MQQTIGFIGGGHMSRAIIAGLVSQPHGKPSIHVFNRGQEKLASLCNKYGVNAAKSNDEIIANCDTVVLSVKPQVLERVCEPLAPLIQKKKPLLVSVAAGIKSHSIERWVGGNVALVRAMPNMPSIIGEGATGMFANQLTNTKQRSLAQSIFESIGMVTWLDEEQDIDKVTAVSGSGPAYFMLMIQSLVDAAVESGMSATAAKELAVQTARGTAGMIGQSDTPLPQLIDDMLLPGGTTEQAVAALKSTGFPSSVKSAYDAANLRAQQLADELSN